MSDSPSLDHFEIYFKVGAEATDQDTKVQNSNFIRTATGIWFNPTYYSIGDGSIIYFAIYAVDSIGNKQKATADLIFDES